MKKIMAVNAGSSSIKFQLLEMPEEELIASGIVERIGEEDAIFTIKYDGKKDTVVLPIKDHSVGVELILKGLVEKKIVSKLEEINGVGHRIVQGGELFQDSAIITDEVRDKVYELRSLAPLHNVANCIGIDAFRKALPNVPQVCVFDTVFHQTMAKEVYMYALPYEYYEKYAIRKYGAHGTSHKYVSERCADIMNKPLKDTKIIVCHVGNGASICAVNGGKCQDTSMGLTPLEGIPMGTRSGNIDPTAIEVVAKAEGKTMSEMINILNKKSGYLGISGVSFDARNVEQGMKEGNERCKLTFDVQAKRICDYIGSYYVLMGGLDAICFAAGIGENSPILRKNVCQRLGVLGVEIDDNLNENGKKMFASGEWEISTPNSKVKVYVISTNEEVMIARDVMRLTQK